MFWDISHCGESHPAPGRFGLYHFLGRPGIAGSSGGPASAMPQMKEGYRSIYNLGNNNPIKEMHRLMPVTGFSSLLVYTSMYELAGIGRVLDPIPAVWGTHVVGDLESALPLFCGSTLHAIIFIGSN